MTETSNIPHQPPPGAGTEPYQQWTPPPPQREPHRRLRQGPVLMAAAVAAATLVAGALGGTVGALVGGAGGAGTPAASQPSGTARTAPAESTDVSAVVAKVLPSVVQVNVSAGNQQGVGSGVIMSSAGRILTNNHVVSGAERLTVTLADGRTVDATMVGTNPSSDLAVLQARGVSGLTAASLGDSSTVKVGDRVIAIGSPAGLQGTVTTGIVSALDREVTVSAQDRESPFPFSRGGSGSAVSYRAIQTDASINQGNSGGPLFNEAGAVIGINSAMYSPVSGPDGSAGSVGIGFAVPINQAKEVIG